MKTSKYKSKKTIIDGITFDSKAEAAYYLHLLELEKQNKIKLLELQPKVYLTNAKILYKPDFLIEENGQMVYIDVKGVVTSVFQIKKRLWKHYGAGLLRLVKYGKVIEEIKSV